MNSPAEPRPEASALPREVGGFRLLRQLGRGGMGVVYEAEELASGRRVALKVLVKELALSEEAFERFRREARIAASVSDSSCVFVFGAHVIEGSPAIAMELCAGETLEHRIASGKPVPVADAVRWTIEILDGLEAAHQAGVVHRDVKPSNCFTTAQGRVKVGDFGLSRSLEQDVQLTRSGVFLGSPLYASPEQVRGRQVDLRSDLYSVGATLYALLTGRSPYHGENLGEVLARILSEAPVPPSEIRKEVPRGLDKVILRAMARDPEQRYASHAAMRDALQAFVGAETQAAGPLRRLFAYLLDSWILSLVHIPLMWTWATFDPAATQQRAGRLWQLDSPWLMLVLQCIGALYFTLAETFFGRTIGKWITGQRVAIAGETQRPTQRLMLRALLWWSAGLLATVCGLLFRDDPPWVRNLFVPLFPLVVNFSMLATMRRRNGWRGFHELASGTRVVAEPLPFARFVRRKAPPAARLEPSDSLPARLGNFATIGRVGRTATGEIFEASDTDLDRRVWIHRLDPAAAPLPPERRWLERPTRLRWLAGFEEQGLRHEVFEAPGGARLLDCCAGEGRLSWPMAHGMISALAEEIDRDPPPRISLEQVWIDRSWSLRILDEPLGENASPPREPLDFLAIAASTALGISPASGIHLPPDLPEHAETTAKRLLGLEARFSTVAEARASLSESARRPQGLNWKIRGLQMLLGSGIWAFFCGIMIFSMRVVVLPTSLEMTASAIVLDELKSGRQTTAADLARGSGAPTGPEIDAEGMAARSILAAQIGDRYTQIGRGAAVKLSQEEKDLVARMKEQHGNATREEIEAARARVASERPADFDYGKSPVVRILRKIPFVMPFWMAAIWTAFAILGAFAVRGGLSMRILSLSVRDAKGRRAGRWRCAWRALCASLPIVAAYFVPAWIGKGDHPGSATIALAAAVAVHLLLIAVSLRNPARGWQDAVAGTRLVPR